MYSLNFYYVSGMKKPKIFHQPEKSYHCGACASASVLHWFGEEPDPVLTLYKDLRNEERMTGDNGGLYSTSIQNYFLRKDWVAIVSHTGGPAEYYEDGRRKSYHSETHQCIATWRVINQMLLDGYLCILEYKTNAGTNHFAVVYDAFIRRNIYWLRLACSAQGYMELQAEDFLKGTGTSQLFIKPHNNEYR